VVAIVDVVDNVDGGCASVVSDDMAALTDESRCVTGAVGSFSVWVVASVVFVLVCILKSTQSDICMVFQ
jgi:hypothetical protein